jgi:predicted ArsR family transcriptional regulator
MGAREYVVHTSGLALLELLADGRPRSISEVVDEMGISVRAARGRIMRLVWGGQINVARSDGHVARYQINLLGQRTLGQADAFLGVDHA